MGLKTLITVFNTERWIFQPANAGKKSFSSPGEVNDPPQSVWLDR
jgi:hypothetical protein